MPPSFEHLSGRCVVVTSSEGTARGEIERLRAAGAEAIHIPLLTVHGAADAGGALDAAIEEIASYDWIAFTSKIAVGAFSSRRGPLPLPSGLCVAAVGPATARELDLLGLPVSFIPKRHDAASLFRGLSDLVRPGERVLWPRGQGADSGAAAPLKRAGAIVHDVEAYRTGMPSDGDRKKLLELISAGRVAAVLLDSPSAVRNLFDIIGRETFVLWAKEGRLIPSGPVTAKAIEKP